MNDFEKRLNRLYTGELIRVAQDIGMGRMKGDKAARIRQIAQAAEEDKTLADKLERALGGYAVTRDKGQKVTVLFLAANPHGTPALRLDEEVRTIEERLRLSAQRERFDLRQQWATRTADIIDALIRHTPDVVHFSGHGDETGELVFEDAAGKAMQVKPAALAQALKVCARTQCVVMNACYSNAHADAIAKVVPVVVGMTRAVADRDAISFASGFYRGLGEGKGTASAFELGRAQVMLDGGEAITPYLRTQAGMDASEVLRGI